MKPHDLSTLGTGFGNEALGSQVVFRSALQAVSHPGRLVDVRHDAQLPSQGHAAAAALLLALLDADCSLWLSPTLALSDAALWLHFHTGCQIISDATLAQFVWVAQGDAMPALASLAQGSETYPDQSATCIVDVGLLNTGAGEDANWTLQGPGIQGSNPLHVEGLASDFLPQWAHNHTCFPRGVDVFFASPTQVVGLPRTTAITLNGGH